MKISIIGAPGAGKTVFLASLIRQLSAAGNSQIRVMPAYPDSSKYIAEIEDDLQAGKWPAPSAVGSLRNLKWKCSDSQGRKHELEMLECAGNDFCNAFGTTDYSILSDTQKNLKKEIKESELVLLLINLKQAIDIFGISGKTKELDALELAPVKAIQYLKKKKIAACILLSQSDIYEELLSEGVNTALEKYLPNVARELTDFPIFPLNSLETTLGEEGYLPQQNGNPVISQKIISAIKNFLSNPPEIKGSIFDSGRTR